MVGALPSGFFRKNLKFSPADFTPLVLLLVLSGFVFEVVDGFHEERDAEQSTVVVLKQQAGRKQADSFYCCNLLINCLSALNNTRKNRAHTHQNLPDKKLLIHSL